MRTSFVRLVSPCLVAFLFAASSADAGPVTGRIVDPDGRAVPGASVVLTDGTTIVARATSTASGQFTVNAPDSGEFEVRVALEGFRVQPLRVAGESAARDVGALTLQVSAVSESVVVSAAQVETPLSSASSSVTIITREDLETHQAESVADALRAVPGLTVASAGGRGAQTSVFPRGGESDYSLVFIDGVQVNSFGGGYDFAHLPAVNVERIEIVRGPQSALYGSNAIGSVIRIVTRRAGAPTASAVVEAGSFDTTRVAAATSGEVKGWNWGGSVERLGSDNANGERAANGQTIENDDYERTLVSASGGWRHGSNAGIRGDVRYTTDDRGNPGTYGSDPGGTYGGIDTIARGSNDWLQASLGGNATVGARAHHGRLHARAPRQRLRQRVRRFRVVVAADDRPGPCRHDHRARPRRLGRRRVPRRKRRRHLHHRDRQRARAGRARHGRRLRRSALEPRRPPLRHRRPPRRADHAPGAGRRYRRLPAAAAVRRRHGGVGEPEDRGGVVPDVDRRQLHQDARRRPAPASGRPTRSRSRSPTTRR